MGRAARVARHMVDMLRSWLSANSCDVAPCARPAVDQDQIGPDVAITVIVPFAAER